MCISPVSIPNPNYGRKVTKDSVSRFKDCTSRYLSVPCGHCPECIKSKQIQLVQRIQCEALGNYLFFCTLTYNNDSIPALEVNGFRITYASVHDLQNMFKRLRKSVAFGRPFRYIAVTELGSQRGRPHIHIIFLVPKYDSDNEYTPVNLEALMFKAVLFEWRRNYGSTRSPVYKPLCTYVRKWSNGRLRSNYDLHYVRPFDSSDGSSNVAFYVLKYMLKDSYRAVRLQQALHMNLDPDEYERVWSIVKPRYVTSLRFGLSPGPDGTVNPDVLSHIRMSIDVSRSISEFPCFINPDSGQTFPIARYYRRFLTYDDMSAFYDRQDHSKDVDSPNLGPEQIPTLSDIKRVIHDYKRVVKQTSENGIFADDF